MNKLEPFRHFRVLFLMLGILILFLGVATTLSITMQRERIMESYFLHAKEEMALIGTLVRESLLSNDYAAIDNFISRWGKTTSDISEIRISAPNGFLLSHYKRTAPALHPLEISSTIEIQDTRYVSLNLTHDVAQVKESIDDLIVQNSSALVLFAIVIGAVLWFVLRKTAFIPMETMITKIHSLNASLEERVKKRTEELIQKNRDLRKEIVERQSTQARLKESEVRYRDLYDRAPDMYHTVDNNGILIDCNETECLMLGYRKDEIIGKPFEQFLTEASRDLYRREFENMQKHQITTISNVERELIRKDGTILPTSLNVYAEYNKSGSLMQTRSILRDITLQKAMEIEMLKIGKLESLGILAGGLAHDFNNLLTSIVGNVSIAQMHSAPEGKAHDRLTQINKAIRRAQDLTKQLLTFAKGGAPVKKRINIKHMLNETACFAVQGSNVRCNCEIRDDLLDIDADAGQLHQVINNLVINAQQAMPDGGAITVAAENVFIRRDELYPLVEGNYVKITFIDMGEGIPEKSIKKIFDPFYSTKAHGTGLGLSTTYSIIKKHGGHINVNSRVPGGTQFDLYLPIAGDKAVETKQEQENMYPGSGRILIMDDERSVRDTVQEMITLLGYEVDSAQNGDSAIDKYITAQKSGTPYDAVILDLTVQGGMGGKETIQKLRAVTPDIKAIVSSGYSNDHIMSRFKEFGFQEALLKPYDMQRLSSVLHRVVNRPA